MTRGSIALLALVVGGCSASISGPSKEHPGLVLTPPESAPVEQSEVSSAAAPAPTQPPPAQHDLPDPEPLTSSVYWEYDLRFEEGAITVARVSRRVFERPVSTARQMGRFAIELWIGRELIDRVRFDFPLIGAEAPPGEVRSIHDAPRFEPGLQAERKVLVPSSDRAIRAQLVDRATGKIQTLPWPPDAPLDPIPSGTLAPGPAVPPPIPE